MPDEDIADSITEVADLDDYDLLEGQSVSEISGVRVFDVGQGDCLGVLDEKEKVVLYVDYGGCIDHPDQADYSNVKSRLDVERSDNGRIGIVLTHWDKDHYYSATKNSKTGGCQWLVPRQKASISAASFAANLPNAACWPEEIGDDPKRFPVGGNCEIEIRKSKKYKAGAKSENRNLTGLAIAVIRKDENGDDEQMILLPGDNVFHKIKNLPDVPIRGLVAYHHGSHTHWHKVKSPVAINKCTTNNTVVYSCGENNPYNHPDKANYSANWSAREIDTRRIRNEPGDYRDILF